MINQTFDGTDIQQVEVLITTFSDKKENSENHITVTLKSGQVFRYVPFLSSFVIIEGEKRRGKHKLYNFPRENFIPPYPKDRPRDFDSVWDWLTKQPEYITLMKKLVDYDNE